MSRFFVGDAAQVVLVQIAIDQALGLRDAAGNATPREQLATLDGGLTFVPASLVVGPVHGYYDRPDTKTRLIVGDDGTTALEIDEDANIDAQLGRTIHGIAIPPAQDLIGLTPARGHNALPPGIMRRLDLGYLDGLEPLADVGPEVVDDSSTLQPVQLAALNAAIDEIGAPRLRTAMQKRKDGG